MTGNDACVCRRQRYIAIWRGNATVRVRFLERKSLGRMRKKSQTAFWIDSIVKAVCDFFRIRPNDLRSKKRTRTVALPRQIAMYLCRLHTHASFPVIGERFGGRDHSTVIHAAHVIERRLREDATFRATVERLERLLERPG